MLLAFEKAGDALISEHALEGARIEDVRALTGQPPTNPMHDSYPVSEAQAPWLEARTGHNWISFVMSTLSRAYSTN